MKWGVPYEGLAMNFVITWLGGMYAGSPLWWLGGIVVHQAMKPLANKNPNFFREWRMWFDTKLAALGGTVYALSPDRATKPRDLATSI
jgi:type IV secretory pathway VirB3-like protein